MSGVVRIACDSTTLSLGPRHDDQLPVPTSWASPLADEKPATRYTAVASRERFNQLFAR
jgi:hypothetical protein